MRHGLGSSDALSRRKALTLVAALPALFGSSQRANAAFGPAGGAVLSKPQLRQLDVDSILALSPEKFAQRAGALSTQRLNSVIAEIDKSFSTRERETLDALIDKLEEERKQNPSPAVDAELLQLEDKLRTASRALSVAKQLRDREEVEQRLAAQPAWVAYGCAAIASIGSTLVAHPIDTYKTLQQSQASDSSANVAEKGKSTSKSNDRKSSSRGAGSGGSSSSASSRFGGALERFSDGSMPSLSALYRGLVPNLVKEAPSSAIYLGIYELVRGELNGPTGPFAANPLIGYLLAGAVGELVGSVVRAPSEATKSKVQSGRAASVGEAVQQVVFDPDGRANTVRAWLSSLLRDVPMGAIQIAIFEVLKAYVIQAPDIECATPPRGHTHTCTRVRVRVITQCAHNILMPRCCDCARQLRHEHAAGGGALRRLWRPHRCDRYHARGRGHHTDHDTVRVVQQRGWGDAGAGGDGQGDLRRGRGAWLPQRGCLASAVLGARDWHFSLPLLHAAPGRAPILVG